MLQLPPWAGQAGHCPTWDDPLVSCSTRSGADQHLCLSPSATHPWSHGTLRIINGSDAGAEAFIAAVAQQLLTTGTENMLTTNSATADSISESGMVDGSSAQLTSIFH